MDIVSASRRSEQAMLIGIIALFLLLGTAWAWVTPLWMPPDETAHQTYVQYLLDRQHFPHYLSHLDFWEAHQPPLYYLALTPAAYLARSMSLDAQVFLLRIFSVCLMACSAIAGFMIGKKLYPESGAARLWIVAAALFLPMAVSISASVNNDVLANCVGAGLIALLVCVAYDKRVTPARLVAVGVGIGIAVLTKVILLPLAAVVGLATLWYSRKKIRGALSLMGLAGAVSGWWIVRNMMVYGDPLGWSKLKTLWPDQYRNMFADGNFIFWVKTFFKSFIGIFGKVTVAYPGWVYALALIGGAGIVGLGIFVLVKRASSADRRTTLWLSTGIILTLASIFYSSLTFFQPQGRYAFPVLFGITAILGMAFRAVPRERTRLLLLVIFSILMLGLNIFGMARTRTYALSHSERSSINTNLVDKNRQWTAPQGLDQLTVQTDGMHAVSTASESFLFSPNDLRIDSSRVTTLRIVLAVTQGKEGSVFLKDSVSPSFSGSPISFPLIADGAPHEYVIPLTNLFSKPTLIQQLRVDPTDTAGSTILLISCMFL